MFADVAAKRQHVSTASGSGVTAAIVKIWHVFLSPCLAFSLYLSLSHFFLFLKQTHTRWISLSCAEVGHFEVFRSYDKMITCEILWKLMAVFNIHCHDIIWAPDNCLWDILLRKKEMTRLYGYRKIINNMKLTWRIWVTVASLEFPAYLQRNPIRHKKTNFPTVQYVKNIKH